MSNSWVIFYNNFSIIGCMKFLLMTSLVIFKGVFLGFPENLKFNIYIYEMDRKAVKRSNKVADNRYEG